MTGLKNKARTHNKSTQAAVGAPANNILSLIKKNDKIKFLFFTGCWRRRQLQQGMF